MAIYCNTLKHNMQYGIDPYCFTPSMYVCMYAYMYVCMYVCMHVCKYVCSYVRMCVYVNLTEKSTSNMVISRMALLLIKILQ